MVIFNSYVKLPEGTLPIPANYWVNYNDLIATSVKIRGIISKVAELFRLVWIIIVYPELWINHD